MPTAEISVDAQDQTLTLPFVDDKDDPTSPPDGLSVSWTSSDETVASVANDPTVSNRASLTLNHAGTVTITASPSGAQEPDGSPFADQSIDLTIDPGAAAADAQIQVNA